VRVKLPRVVSLLSIPIWLRSESMFQWINVRECKTLIFVFEYLLNNRVLFSFSEVGGWWVTDGYVAYWKAGLRQGVSFPKNTVDALARIFFFSTRLRARHLPARAMFESVHSYVFLYRTQIFSFASLQGNSIADPK
jgi:hypothetical protein